MNRAYAIATWAATASMEVSWLAAWSAFTLAAFVRGAYPVEEFAAVFAAASALTSWSRRVGLSTIQLTALQVVGLGLFELHTFQSIGRAHGLAFCVWTAILWISGLLHARRAMDYATVCTRFDRGLAWLFSLMLFELLLRGQQGVALDPEATRAWLLPFVVSGVLAIVLTRNAARELRLQTALASAALLCVVGVVTVGLPDLRSPSVRTHGVSAVLDPLGSKAVEVFFWIGNIFEQSPGAAVSQREAMWSQPASRAGGSARKAMSWGSESSQLWAAVCVVFAVVFAIWAARRWLFLRRERDAPAVGWLALLRAWFRGWTRSKEVRAPIRAYFSLRRWGARSGVVSRPSETPIEYAQRLKRRIPESAGEIDLIVAEYCTCAYGSALEGASQSSAALRRLANPVLLPRRIQSWLRGDID